MFIAHHVRTTVDIDTPILRELKRLQKREGKTLGRLISELLAEALGRRKAASEPAPTLAWHTMQGRLLVDLADNEAGCAILDTQAGREPPE